MTIRRRIGHHGRAPALGARIGRRGRAVAVALLAPFLAGCASATGVRYRGPASDHFDGQRFHNYVRIDDDQLGDALRIALHTLTGHRGHWRTWEEVPRDTPPARVGAGVLRVTFVNHATVLVQMDGLNLLTDPVWSARASPVSWAGPARHRPPGIRFDDLPPIDVVLLSHDHYDHMDVPTLKRLVRRFHPRIVAGLGVARSLAVEGVHGAEVLDWWQSTTLAPGVRLTGVPAQHWSAREFGDKYRTLWLGFVIDAPAGPVYFAGDTGFGPFFPAIRDRFRPFRLAILPVAPARPRAAMAPRHLSAEDAVQVDSILGAPPAMAMHFGTFQQGDDAEDEPVAALRTALAARGACAPRFWAPRNGEAREVPTAAAAPACVRGAVR